MRCELVVPRLALRGSPHNPPLSHELSHRGTTLYGVAHAEYAIALGQPVDKPSPGARLERAVRGGSGRATGNQENTACTFSLMVSAVNGLCMYWFTPALMAAIKSSLAPSVVTMMTGTLA